MRLGFSIAINVNPEVLLVDEVLAVGDAAFVPKCLDRIDDFRRRKKTILFVSHDLSTVSKICNRVAWIKNGKIKMLGEPKRVVDAYMQDVTEEQEAEFRDRKEERRRPSRSFRRRRRMGRPFPRDPDDQPRPKPTTTAVNAPAAGQADPMTAGGSSGGASAKSRSKTSSSKTPGARKNMSFIPATG